MRLFAKSKKDKNSPRGRITVAARGKIVYIRVPKCGNTSIVRALGKKVIEEKIDFSELKKFYPRSKVFSFVRNPWDRLASGYADKMRVLDTPDPNVTDIAMRLTAIDERFVPGMPFAEFVELICALSDKEVEKHFCSQSFFLKQDGDLVPDFIGRLERIEQDWLELEKLLGVRLPLMHLNKTDSIDYKAYYTDSSLRDMVAERYAEDIETFGYEFGD